MNFLAQDTKTNDSGQDYMNCTEISLHEKTLECELLKLQLRCVEKERDAWYSLYMNVFKDVARMRC